MDDKKYTEEMVKNINKKLKGKQASLRFDDTPTDGSTNPVTSDGLKKYADTHGGKTYKAGSNIQIEDDVISATDTVYTAGENVTIEDNVISATNTQYVAGNNITLEDWGEDTKRISASFSIPTYTGGRNVDITLQSGVNYEINAYYVPDKTYSTTTAVEDPSSFESVELFVNPPVSMSGDDVWTDGENVYYSDGQNQFIFDRENEIWKEKVWTGLTSFSGRYIWSDGENIYFSYYSSQYVLDLANSSWSSKTWYGLSVTGDCVWSDGGIIYYSRSGENYVLDKASSTWSAKTWTGASAALTAPNIWTDGENIYFSNGPTQYVLDRATSTWSQKTWRGLTNFYGYCVWTDGRNIYYSAQTTQYVLDKTSSTWRQKVWTGLTDFYGENIWTDGVNVFSGHQWKLQFPKRMGKPCISEDYYAGEGINIANRVISVKKDEYYLFTLTDQDADSDAVSVKILIPGERHTEVLSYINQELSQTFSFFSAFVDYYMSTLKGDGSYYSTLLGIFNKILYVNISSGLNNLYAESGSDVEAGIVTSTGEVVLASGIMSVFSSTLTADKISFSGNSILTVQSTETQDLN